jgi:hypothetical protein
VAVGELNASHLDELRTGVDDFSSFIGSQARPNTVGAYAYDLKLFYTLVDRVSIYDP